jgi:hypothetical protein
VGKIITIDGEEFSEPIAVDDGTDGDVADGDAGAAGDDNTGDDGTDGDDDVAGDEDSADGQEETTQAASPDLMEETIA